MCYKCIKPSIRLLSALAAGLALYVPVSQAFNFGDMMNPGRWFGGGRDRYYDDWYDGPWGGPWGWGPYGPYGGYGYPGFYGAPYGWPGLGVPPFGYGAPYAAPAPAQTQPQSQSSGSSRVDPKEIETLKRRIEQLESRQQMPPAPGPQGQSGPEWPSMPGFRPMNQ